MYNLANKRKIKLFFLKLYINKKNYFSLGLLAIAFLGYVFLFNGQTQIAEAVKVEYTEDFASEVFKDGATTLDWDTTLGELKIVGGNISGSAISSQINNALGIISNVSFIGQDFDTNGQTVDFLTNVVGGALNWQIDMSTTDVNTTPVVRSFTLSYDVQDYNDDFTTNDYLDKTSTDNDMLWDTANDQLIPPPGVWTHVDESAPQIAPWVRHEEIGTLSSSFASSPNIKVFNGVPYVATVSNGDDVWVTKYIAGSGWADLNDNIGSKSILSSGAGIFSHQQVKMLISPSGDLMISAVGQGELFFAKWTQDPVLCAPDPACFTNMAETIVGPEQMSSFAVNTRVSGGSYVFELDNNGNPGVFFSEELSTDPAGTNTFYFTRWNGSNWTYADQVTVGLETLGNLGIGGVFFGDFEFDSTNNVVLARKTNVGKWTPGAGAVVCGGPTDCWTYLDESTVGFEAIPGAGSGTVNFNLNSNDEVFILWSRLLFTRWDSSDGRWEKMNGAPGYETLASFTSIATRLVGNVSFDANDYPLVIFNKAFPTPTRLFFTRWNGSAWTHADGQTTSYPACTSSPYCYEELSDPGGLGLNNLVYYDVTVDSNGYPMAIYCERQLSGRCLYRFQRYNGYGLTGANNTSFGYDEILKTGELTNDGNYWPSVSFDQNTNEIYAAFSGSGGSKIFLTKYDIDQYDVDPFAGSTTRKGISNKVNRDRYNYIKTATLTGTPTTVPGSTVSYFMSNDGGSNWESVSLNTPHTFTSCTATSADFDYNCNDLRYKVEITNTVDNQVSFIDDLQIEYDIDETQPDNTVTTSSVVKTNDPTYTLSGTTDWPYATLWINNEFIKRLDGTGPGPYTWTHEVPVLGTGDVFDIKIKNNKVLDTPSFSSDQILPDPGWRKKFISLKYTEGEYKDGVIVLKAPTDPGTGCQLDYKIFKKDEFNLANLQSFPWQTSPVSGAVCIDLGIYPILGTAGQDGYGRLWILGENNGIGVNFEYYYSDDLGQTWTYGVTTGNSESSSATMVVDPNDPSVFYYGTQAGYYTSMRVSKFEVNPLGSPSPFSNISLYKSATTSVQSSGSLLLADYKGDIYFYHYEENASGDIDAIYKRKLTDWNTPIFVTNITTLDSPFLQTHKLDGYYHEETNETLIVSGGFSNIEPVAVFGILSHDGGQTFSDEFILRSPYHPTDPGSFGHNGVLYFMTAGSFRVNTKTQNTTGYQSPVVRVAIYPQQSSTTGGGTTTSAPTAPINFSCQATTPDKISWQFEDTADNETGFKLFGPEGLILDTLPAITTDLSSLEETMLEINTLYPDRYVKAFNGVGDSPDSNTASCYTLANTPNMLIAETGEDYITVILNPEDGNPEGTEYAIFEVNTGSYVQLDGSFAGTEAWLTYDGWGGQVDVVGGETVDAQFNIALDTSQEYNFAVKARNGDGVETAFSDGTTGEVVGEEPPVSGQPSIVVSKGVGINIGQGQLSQVFAKAVFATSGQAAQSISERLIIEFSLILNIVLGILIVLLLITIYEAIKHIQVKGFGNKIKIALNLLHKEPAVIFADQTGQDKKGTYGNSYEKYKRLHEYSQKTIERALGIIILKLIILVVLILGVIGVNHSGIAQVAPYNQDGQEIQQGDILSYNIVFTNQGDSAASNVLITDIMDSYVGYVDGSGVLNKGGEVIDGVTRTNQQISFAIGDLDASETGYAIFDVQVNSNEVGRQITNNAQMSGDNFTSQESNTVTNTIIETTEPVEPPVPPEQPVEPPIEPPVPPIPPTPEPPTPPVTPPTPPGQPVTPPTEPTPPGQPIPPTEPVVTSEPGIMNMIWAGFFDNPRIEDISLNIITPLLLILAALNTIPTALFLISNILLYLHLLFFEPFLWLFRKKREKWGIVYDALTKLPIDLAVVRLYSKESRKLVQTRVTDKKGRYLMIVKKPGQYYLSVSKPGYLFPTQFLKDSTQDTKYLDLYHGEAVEISEENIALTVNIPLDAKDKKAATAKEIIHSYLIKNLRLIVSYVGIALAILVVLIIPTAITIGALIIHIALFAIFRRLIVPKKPKSWGIIYDSKNKKPLKHAVVKIFDMRFNKLLEAQVSDSKGRYAFLLGKNEYQMLTEKSGYQRKQVRPVDLVRNEEIINLDVGLDKDI
jgi:uncharacterized repeat protein (TIGR01451 family)